MSEIKKIEFSEEDMRTMDLAAGYEREVVTDPIQQAEEVEVIVTQEPEVVTTEEVVETIEEQDEPQLIIQETEPEPITQEQQPEVVSTKVKAKIYKDSFQASLNKYYNSTENPDVEAFARAWNANYDNLSPIEIIRQDVLSDPFTKGLRPSAINKLVQERLSKFDLESDDPDERADAEDLLKREAEIVKSKMVKAGKEFVSQFESDLEIEVDAPVTETKKEPTPEEVQAWREAKSAEYAPEVSKFVKNGVIQIQDKDGVINIPAVDQQEYINSLLDPVGFIQSIAINPDGTPNYGKWIQFVTAAKNLNSYNSTMVKHGIAIGQEKFAGKIKNEAPLGKARPVEGVGEIKTPKEDPAGFIQAVSNIRPWKPNQ